MTIHIPLERAQDGRLLKGSASTPEPTTHHYDDDNTNHMDAYDTATLHLEKAETLVALLMAIDGTGAQQNLPTKALGLAFSSLCDELGTVRAALRQLSQRGDA